MSIKDARIFFLPPLLFSCSQNRGKADISAVVVEQQQNGKRVLQLSRTALDGIFQARQNRVAALLEVSTISFQTLGISMGLGFTF